MKTIIAAILVSFVALSAQAGSAAKESVPPITATRDFNWTGFYAGVFGSYKRSVVDPQLTLGGTFNQIPPLRDALANRGSHELDDDGGELGGLFGYNYQIGHLVFGMEADAGYLWARDSYNTGAFVLGEGVPPLAVRESFKTHYLITIGPRLGYAFNRFLPYITGGLAIGDLDWSEALHDLADPASRLPGKTSDTNAGWMVGGGMQYALTNHWSVRVQYQYIDLGSTSFDAHVTTSSDFLGHSKVSLTEHNASFAIIYQF